MGTEYAVEIVEYGGIMLLYQKINWVLTNVGRVPFNYAVDKEITAIIKSAVEMNAPFMKSEGRAFYNISEDFGEALKMHIKVFEMLPTLHEKLLYIDRTQIFSLVAGQQFKELRDRLNIYYVAKKIEGNLEGS